jgi:hypothetical protein
MGANEPEMENHLDKTDERKKERGKTDNGPCRLLRKKL